MSQRKNKKATRQAASDIMHSVRELARAIGDGVPLHERFTVRTVSIPEAGKYSPDVVKKLAGKWG